MSTSPEAPAKTLTLLVARRIKHAMVDEDILQSELARRMGKNEQWLSVRLRGRQSIDVNDLALIAKALGVGLSELIPSDDEAASASVSVR
jgi:transcriptional regulator with XRE-family HTH domain